jgi:hypothetical protein
LLQRFKGNILPLLTTPFWEFDIMRGMRAQTEDWGALLELPCPQCDKNQWFHLQQHSSSFNLMGMQLGKSCSCSLHCKKCKYPVHLKPEDTQKAIQLLPFTQQFLKDELSEPDFKAALEKLNFEFLKEIEAANTNMICPNCGEECPLTFSECWSCGQEIKQNTAEDPEAHD